MLRINLYISLFSCIFALYQPGNKTLDYLYLYLMPKIKESSYDYSFIEEEDMEHVDYHCLFKEYTKETWNEEVSYKLKKNISNIYFVYPQLEGENKKIPRINELIRKEAEIAYESVWENSREWDDRKQDYIIQYNSEDFISILFYRIHSYSMIDRFQNDWDIGSYATVNIDLTKGEIVELIDIVEDKEKFIEELSKDMIISGLGEKSKEFFEGLFYKNNFRYCMYFRENRIGFANSDYGNYGYLENKNSSYSIEFPMRQLKAYMKKEASYQKYMGDYIQFERVNDAEGESTDRIEEEKNIKFIKNEKSDGYIKYPQLLRNEKVNETIREKAMERKEEETEERKSLVVRYKVEYEDADIISITFWSFLLNSEFAERKGIDINNIDWNTFQWDNKKFVSDKQTNRVTISLKTGKEINLKKVVDTENKDFQNLLLQIERHRTRSKGNDTRKETKDLLDKTIEQWKEMEQAYFKGDKIVFSYLEYSIWWEPLHYSYVIPYSEITPFLIKDLR